METLNKETLDVMTPLEALEMLKEGNHRFVNNLKVNRNLLQQVNETKDGQHPMAVILSCIDSRTSAELIFDQGLGDVFSVRVAGNILNDDILGSMEFACKVAGAKIIVVLGHTRCGAVQGAVDGVKMGHLTQLLKKLQPAVKKTLESPQVHKLGPLSVTNMVAENNVHLTIDQILDSSEILRKMVDKGLIGIVGGMYDVENGHVVFFDEDVRMKISEDARSFEIE